MEKLLIYISVIIYVFIASIIEVAIEEKRKKDHPELAVNQDVIDDQMKCHNTKEYVKHIKTNTDREYCRRVSIANEKKESTAEKVALSCPNCGAPLKAIYYRCEYCDLSYKEAQDLQEEIGRVGGEAN